MSWIRVIAALLVVSLPVQAQLPRAGGLAPEDKEVLRQMAEMHLAGIEAGALATQNGSLEVKKLGAYLIEGHRRMLNEVVGLTQSLGEQQPSAPSLAQRGLLIELAGLSGPAFDRRFLNAMTQHQEEVLGIAERTAGEAANSSVKMLAQEATSYIRLQLHAARTLSTTLTASK